MSFYHGTNAKYVSRIVEEGLRPRGRRTGNWKHTISSNPKAVYLTDAYAPHYSLASLHGKETEGVIFEIDPLHLDFDLLHPDEDVLEQVGRGHDDVPGDIWQRTKHYRRIAKHNPNWELSLMAMGSCAYYGPVSPEAIERYVIVDWSKIPSWLRIHAGDSTPNLYAYQIHKSQFKAITDILFGRQVNPEDIIGEDIAALHRNHNKEGYRKFITSVRSFLEEPSGITIVNRR